jgi:peptidyl-prolyl cis-trans isomerase D
MMDSLRKGASGLVVKAFLAVLMASFVLWGVADVFRGYGARAVATVAGREIQPEQFQQAFEQDYQRIQSQSGRSITREMARKFGLEQQVLGRLVQEAVLDAHAQDLKLSLTDQAILDTIKQDPSFQGANGEFSKDMFANLLRANGLTEHGFFASQRTAQVRGQVATTTQIDKWAPNPSVAALHRYRNETRTLALVPVPVEKAPAIADPDEAKLKTHHETFKAQYSAPEYRKLALLSLDPASFKKLDAVTDDEAKVAYEQRKASFGSAEKRTLQLLSFKDQAAAEKGQKDLKAGKDFLTLGKELGLKESDINLGVQTKAQMIDQVIAETAFGLKKNEVSKPFQGTFSTVIVRANEITPAIEKTYDQVKAELREAIAKDKAMQDAQAVQDKIENARSRGASLKELAEKHGLKLQEIPSISQEGYAPDNKAVADILGGIRVLTRAFTTEVGVEAEGVDLQDGFVTWFEVQGITPSVLRPLETVKEQVKQDWLSVERRKALQELAQKMTDRLNKGEAIEAIAKELGQKVAVTKPLKRDDKADGIAPAGVNLAFSLAKGAAAHADSGQSGGDAGAKGGRVLIKVDTVTVPAAPEKADADKLTNEISQQLSEDLASQYMASLQSRYGVKINQDALNRAAGRTAN